MDAFERYEAATDRVIDSLKAQIDNLHAQIRLQKLMLELKDTQLRIYKQIVGRLERNSGAGSARL